MSPKLNCRNRWIIPACILFFLATYGSRAQQQPRVIGFFSDMRYIADAGDVLGTEVWIVYGGQRYYATVQVAEGAPSAPVVVPVEVSGWKVRFTIKQPVVDQEVKRAPDVVTNFN